MKISIEKRDDKFLTEFDGRDEKDILFMYEVLGVEICEQLGYNFKNLLELMQKRNK